MSSSEYCEEVYALGKRYFVISDYKKPASTCIHTLKLPVNISCDI